MADGRIGRGLMVPLLAVNFVVYLIVLGLAGWSIDKYIDGEQDHPHLGGNESTTYMLVFALIGGAMGAASVLSGFMHRKAWGSASLANATSSAAISWGVTAIAFGLAWKEIKMGGHNLLLISESLMNGLLILFCYLLLLSQYSLAWKEIKMGGHRGKRLQTLELFITISTLSQLLYLILLHAGIFNRKYGPDYRSNGNDVVRHELPPQATSTSMS